MQFLAFLKDSYREARSGWVLQAMLVLAGLLLLFVLSVGFRPITVKEGMDSSLSFMGKVLRSNPNFGSTRFEVENYTETNPAEPWKSDYAFDLVVKSGSAEELKRVQEGGNGLPTTRARTERFVSQAMPFLNNIDVKKAIETPSSEARFRVTTRGTKATDVTAWLHVPRVLFGVEIPLLATSLRNGVYMIENWLVNGAGTWVTLLVAVIVTAGFVPTMLQKGAFDLIASKPVGRTRLLVYKYVGGLTFVLLLTAVTIGGVWLILGLRTGIWSPNFLAVIPLTTFYFAVLYAVAVAVAVFTRSTMVAILATLLAWVLFWGVGKVNDKIADRQEAAAGAVPAPGEEPDIDDMLRKIDPDAPLWGILPKASFPVFTGLHLVAPRTYQLDARLGRVIAEGVMTEAELQQAGYDRPPRERWGEVFGVSLAFIAVMLGLASWRFATRDG